MTYPWHNPKTPHKPSVCFGMSDRQYNAIPAMRWSTLKAILDSPRALQHRLATPLGDSPALRIGRATHLRILQPEVYRESVAVVPDEHLTPSGGLSRKAAALHWRAEAEATHEAVITPAEEAEIVAWARLVEAHAGARAMMREASAREVVAVWHEDDGHGGIIVCKARADLLGHDLLADLKTWSPRSGLSARAFGAECWRRMYHAQLGFYSRGFERAGLERGLWTERRGFIVVDKNGGGDVAALDCDGDMVAAGNADAEAALDALRAALAADSWPGALPERCSLSLPAYAYESDNDADSLGLVGLED